MNVRREHFMPNLPHHMARDLFKDSVEIVPIAISRHCNRKCDYCPDSIVDRFSHHDLIAPELFASVLRQLGLIEFEGTVAVNRYNEPLYDADYAIACVTKIRGTVPKAKIEISTNGDFLDSDMVLSLRDAGVTNLVATCHAQPGVHNFSALKKLLEARVKKLGLPTSSVQGSHNWLHFDIDAGPGIKFFYRCFDADSRTPDGRLAAVNNRGDSLDDFKDVFVRLVPCFRPFRAFEIEWDGSLWPCCQIHNDVPAHLDYCLGHLTPDSDIFAEWTSEKYVAWRKELFAYGEKKAPCTNCNYLIVDGLEHTAENMRRVEYTRSEFAL